MEAHDAVNEIMAMEGSLTRQRIMISEIIEAFSEFLAEKHIVIDNPEKADSENPENIYGTDYGDLYDRVEAVLIAYDVAAPDER